MSEQIALQQGDAGAGVLALQNALIQRGYELPSGADGAYGPETAEAVRAWKKDNSTDLLSPIADGPYVTERELDLIGVSAVAEQEESEVASFGGSGAGEIILVGAATAVGIILALDE